MVKHVLLELKTGQDSEKNAESAMQLFSALPALQDNIFQQLKNQDERLSFEIALNNQLIVFYIYVPARLEEYLRSIILANYPQAVVTRLSIEKKPELDPTQDFKQAAELQKRSNSKGSLGENQVNKKTGIIRAAREQARYQASLPTSHAQISIIDQTISPSKPINPIKKEIIPDITPPSHLLAGYVVLRHKEYLPIKDYREFGAADSLSPILSVLSKGKKGEQAIIQFIVRDDGDRWKNKAPTGSSAEETESNKAAAGTQKALISSKTKEKGLNFTIRIGVLTPQKEQSQYLMESIIHAFRNTTKEISNFFLLKTPHVSFNRKFGDKVHRSLLLESSGQIALDLFHRKFSKKYSFHLSVYEAATLWHLPNFTLSSIPNISWGKNLLGEPPELLPIVNSQTSAEDKNEINVFAQTVYKNEMSNFGLWRADRRRHMYVIGKTGTGKSTMLGNMAINDLRHNEGFCFIDPHGDAVEDLLNYIPAHRINDVVYFNPADEERTVKINLFEGKNIAHRELIASGIIGIFKKMFGNSWGPRLEHFLRNALLTLLQVEDARLSDVNLLFTDKKFRDKVIGQLTDPVLRAFWEGEFNPLQDRQRQESIAPILNKVGQFVSSPLLRNVINASQSSFSIEDLMDQGKILLVNLSQGRLGEDNAMLLGAMMITKIQLAAMGRVNMPEEERRDFYLYVDEFQNFATESFVKILSEARKYRLSLILANQYIAQIDETVQKAIFGNCGNVVSFVMGSEDAKIFSAEYGGVYTPSDLVQLNKHQIINRITISNVISAPFSSYTLPPPNNSNQNRDKVIRVSRERYAADDEIIEQELKPYIPPKDGANEPFWAKKKKKVENEKTTEKPPSSNQEVGQTDEKPTEKNKINEAPPENTSKKQTPEQIALIAKANLHNPNHPSYIGPKKK